MLTEMPSLDASTVCFAAWVTLRFFDTNTTVNLKCLELLHALFEGLVESGYRMSDYEGSSFLPYLVQKVSVIVTHVIDVNYSVEHAHKYYYNVRH